MRARSRRPDRSVHAGARRFPGSPPRSVYTAALPTPPRSATAARGQRAHGNIFEQRHLDARQHADRGAANNADSRVESGRLI